MPPSSSTSVFSEPDDYQAELQRVIGFVLTVAGAGDFRAALTRIDLPRIHLMAGEESLRAGFSHHQSAKPHDAKSQLPPQRNSNGVLGRDSVA